MIEHIQVLKYFFVSRLNHMALTAVTTSSMQVESMTMDSLKPQGGVTPIESIVTTATVDQNLDRLFSVV